MPNRLMTPFCFASVMAAMLLADGALAGSFQNASSAPKDSAKTWARPAASGDGLKAPLSPSPRDSAD